MDVIINDGCKETPDDVELVTSYGQAASNLLYCLGYDPLHLPTADLLSSINKLKGSWVILTPIHWQATHNDAMIVASGQDLLLTEVDSKYWFNLLAEYLGQEGMFLHYHDPFTWLLEVTNKPPLNAKSVNTLVNQSLMPELAQLDSTMFWQKFFTECQMFFASHPNDSLINGTWAWGVGPLKDKTQVSICADEQFLSMADSCSTRVTPYSPSIHLKDYQIIILNQIDTLSIEHQDELNKIPAHWYWNNLAYARKNLNWFARIWRTLTHAH